MQQSSPAASPRAAIRPDGYADLDTVADLRRMLREDKPSLLLGGVAVGSRAEKDYQSQERKAPDLLKTSSSRSAMASRETAQTAFHYLEELIEEKRTELRRVRTLLVGDAHSLNEEEIDRMSIDELLEHAESKKIFGAVYNLQQDQKELSSRWTGSVSKFLSPSYWSNEQQLLKERIEHARSIAEDYKRTISELNASIQTAEKSLTAARSAEAERQQSLAEAREAQSAGRNEQVEALLERAEAGRFKLNSALERSYTHAVKDILVDWRRHQQGFNDLRELGSDVERNYGNLESNLRTVQKVGIITVAASTTAMTGGATGAFWGPVLLGTGAGFGLSALCNTAEQTSNFAHGREVDVAGALEDSGLAAGESFLACLGAGWAARSAYLAAGPGVTGQTASILQRFGKFAGRRWMGGRLGIKAALPSTGFHTGHDIYRFYESGGLLDEAGNPVVGMDPRSWKEWSAKLIELSTAAFGGELGHRMATFRREVAQRASSGVLGNLATKALNTQSHIREFAFGYFATEFQILVAEGLLQRELTDQQKQQMRVAGAVGWAAGVATESVQHRQQKVAEGAQETVTRGAARADEYNMLQTGVDLVGNADAGRRLIHTATGNPVRVVQSDTNPPELRYLLLDSKTRQPLTDATGQPMEVKPETCITLPDVRIGNHRHHIGSNVVELGAKPHEMAARAKAAELHRYRQTLHAVDKVTGSPLAKTLTDVQDALTLFAGSTAFGQKMGRQLLIDLKDRAADAQAIGKINTDHASSVAAGLERFRNIAEAALEDHKLRADAFRQHKGRDYRKTERSETATSNIGQHWRSFTEPDLPENANWFTRNVSYPARTSIGQIGNYILTNPIGRAYYRFTHPETTPETGFLQRKVFNPVRSSIGNVTDYAGKWLKLNYYHDPMLDLIAVQTTSFGDRTGGPRVYADTAISLYDIGRPVGNLTFRRGLVNGLLGLKSTRPRDASGFLADGVEFKEFSRIGRELEAAAKRHNLEFDSTLLNRIAEAESTAGTYYTQSTAGGWVNRVVARAVSNAPEPVSKGVTWAADSLGTRFVSLADTVQNNSLLRFLQRTPLFGSAVGKLSDDICNLIRGAGYTISSSPINYRARIKDDLSASIASGIQRARSIEHTRMHAALEDSLTNAFKHGSMNSESFMDQMAILYSNQVSNRPIGEQASIRQQIINKLLASRTDAIDGLEKRIIDAYTGKRRMKPEAFRNHIIALFSDTVPPARRNEILGELNRVDRRIAGGAAANDGPANAGNAHAARRIANNRRAANADRDPAILAKYRAPEGAEAVPELVEVSRRAPTLDELRNMKPDTVNLAFEWLSNPRKFEHQTNAKLYDVMEQAVERRLKAPLSKLLESSDRIDRDTIRGHIARMQDSLGGEKTYRFLDRTSKNGRGGLKQQALALADEVADRDPLRAMRLRELAGIVDEITTPMKRVGEILARVEKRETPLTAEDLRRFREELETFLTDERIPPGGRLLLLESARTDLRKKRSHRQEERVSEILTRNETVGGVGFAFGLIPVPRAILPSVRKFNQAVRAARSYRPVLEPETSSSQSASEQVAAAARSPIVSDGQILGKRPSLKVQAEALLADPANAPVFYTRDERSLFHRFTSSERRSVTKIRAAANRAAALKLGTDAEVRTRLGELLSDPTSAPTAKQRTLAEIATDTRLPTQERLAAEKQLLNILNEPRAHLHKLLGEQEALRTRAEKELASLVTDTTRPTDTRHRNLGQLSALLHQAEMNFRTKIGLDTVMLHREQTVWDSAPSVRYDGIDRNRHWENIGDRIPELERAGYGRAMNSNSARHNRFMEMLGSEQGRRELFNTVSAEDQFFPGIRSAYRQLRSLLNN